MFVALLQFYNRLMLAENKKFLFLQRSREGGFCFWFWFIVIHFEGAIKLYIAIVIERILNS